MKSNIIGGIIGLTLLVILVGSTLVPAIDNITNSTKETMTNTDGIKAYMELVDDATASYDGSTLLINEEEVTSFGATYSMITADTFLVRTTSGGCAFYSIDGEAALGSWSMTCTDGVCTVTDLSDNTTTYTYDYDWLYIPTADNASSDWICTAGNSTYYVTKDSYIYMSLHDANIVIEGTVGNLTVTSNGEPADYSLTMAAVDGYENTYKLTNIVVTVNDTDYTINRLVLSTSVESYTEENSTYNSLFGVIPVVILAGILIASVRMAIRKD